MLNGGVATTAEVAARAYVRKLLGIGSLDKFDYGRVRRALAEIAEPIGRAGGMGPPIIWRLRG